MNKKSEKIGIIFVYLALFLNAYFMQDSFIALVSSFCGITYTILAGKGNPICYFIGLTGSAFYMYLAYSNHLWGNLLLYGLYFVPMQVLGFFKWSQYLKENKYEIIKTKLCLKEKVILFSLTLLASILCSAVLAYLEDKSPIIDGFATIFSILGMYLTVRRAIEQWYVWAVVNALSFLMWLIIAIQGEKVYSTVIMWGVYFILALYFYRVWKKELFDTKYFGDKIIQRECESQKRRGFYGV